jgi:3-deoxy-7-phosphoheptulonate synthase
VLTFGASLPVVKLGRMAGQFAKPRSSDVETVDGVTLPSYRGDIVNGPDFTAEARIPTPPGWSSPTCRSAATLNLLRAFAPAAMPTCTRCIAGTSTSRRAARSPTATPTSPSASTRRCASWAPAACPTCPRCGRTEFYTSHESLLLPFEEALTRQPSTHPGRHYACSAHFLWIGDRTRQPDGAHVEFMRGVANPIGMKVGPSMEAEELLRLTEILNPANEKGRLTLISRMGADKVEAKLPALLRAVRRAGRNVTWLCDPMHGNGVKAGAYKTRSFDAILARSAASSTATRRRAPSPAACMSR